MRKIEERRPNNNFAQGLLPQQVSGQFFSSKDCINFLTLMASIVDKKKIQNYISTWNVKNYVEKTTPDKSLKQAGFAPRDTLC